MQKKAAYRVLSTADRAKIQCRLNDGTTMSDIAKELDRSISTITREIDKHKITIESAKNHCLYYFSGCNKHDVCDNPCFSRKCSRCHKKNCWEYCEDYTEAYCERLSIPPYVCNGCPEYDKQSCHYNKSFYDAGAADRAASKIKHSKAAGYDYTEAELNTIDDIISPLIKNGHSVYAALVESKDILESKNISLSKSTLYRMIGDSVLSCKNIDLPERVRRKVKLKKRNPSQGERLSVRKAGRMWEDYCKYIEKHDTPTVQMDCVEGKQSEDEALLTLYWKDTHLQIAMILERQDMENVVAALDKLETMLGYELFVQMMPLILTDNGHEFNDIDGMERSFTKPGKKRTMIFFCEPNRSDQKGGCERNHREMRRIIPKGTSLAPFMQSDISLMMDHVNSYVRESLYGKCPYDIAKSVYPKDFFLLLGLEKIPAKEVIMNPKLLKHK